MKGPTPGRLRRFACKSLALGGYLNRPGDGRVRAQIPARHLLWALIVCSVLREGAFHAIESLVRKCARRLGVGHRFGDDTLAYFTERLDPERAREGLAEVVRRAKRNKAFDDRRFIGLVVDGTGAARSHASRCSLCHPIFDADHEVVGYNHRFALLSVVGGGMVLPLDVEPYGPGDGEVAASTRLLERVVGRLGRRFADYVVGDGLYAGAPFLHAAGKLGLHTVVRLKGNLPELYAAAQARFTALAPTVIIEDGKDRVEIWDAEDFDPWETLNWPTVRVLRYRQFKPDGSVVEAYWLTDWPSKEVGSRALYAMAKSRWGIENGGFNDGKNRYGMERIRHHHPNSLLIGWLLICLAMTLERLYRLRFLHRGGRPPRAAADLLQCFWLSLGCTSPDTS